MQTTLDIDDLILKDIKRLQAYEGKSLGRLVSDLLAQALATPRVNKQAAREFNWISRPMGARVDLADREALLDAMDEPAR